jgi:hypothetical protein
MHKNGCFFNNLIYFLPSHPKSPNLLNLKGIVQKRWINPDLLSKNLKLCIETTSKAFGGHISIHTNPLPGQRLFGGPHIYPYETPAGAKAFWGHISIHRKPLPGQRLLGATYLSIGNPCRGKGFLGPHIYP